MGFNSVFKGLSWEACSIRQDPTACEYYSRLLTVNRYEDEK
jgi:hypothetical protein